CHLEKTLIVLHDEAACASEGRTLAIDTDLMHLPVRLANHPRLDAVGRAVWRCRGEHDRQTSNTWSRKQDRPFEGALRSQRPRRLSMRSSSRNEDHDYRHPLPPELPPCLDHGVSSSGRE